MEEVTKWKMTSRIAYRWAERRTFIKPGQIFSAKESEIPKELKKYLIPAVAVNDIPKPKIEEPKKVVIEKPPVVNLPVMDDLAVGRETFNGSDFTYVEEKPKIKYRIKERNNGEVIWWDILDPDGKVMNDTPLDREEALEKVKQLRG